MRPWGRRTRRPPSVVHASDFNQRRPYRFGGTAAYAALVGVGVALAAIFLVPVIFEPFLAIFLPAILELVILVLDILVLLIFEDGVGVALADAFFFLTVFLVPAILVSAILVLDIFVSVILETGVGVGSAIAAEANAMVTMPVHKREVSFIGVILLEPAPRPILD